MKLITEDKHNPALLVFGTLALLFASRDAATTRRVAFSGVGEFSDLNH